MSVVLPIFRVGVFACGNGIDGMFSEPVCHLDFCCYFSFPSSSSYCFLCFELHAATASVQITWCMWFCVLSLLPRAIVMTDHFPKKRAICKYLFTFHFRAFDAMLVACLARRTCRRFLLAFRRLFLPRLELFFGRYYIFENATHFIFFSHL